VSNWFRKTQHVPDRTYSLYMLWIPLIGGSLGAILGGFISDKCVLLRFLAWACVSRVFAQAFACVARVVHELATPLVPCRVVNRVRADGTKMGVRGRMLVVIVSNILAAPFAASALLIHHSAPWGFLSLIGSNGAKNACMTSYNGRSCNAAELCGCMRVQSLERCGSACS
jgi:hypothetical protein